MQEYKCWAGPFAAIASGKQTHDVRKLEGHEGLVIGDIIRYREFTPDEDGGFYSGQEVYVRVTHITEPGTWGIPEDVVVFSIQRVASTSSQPSPNFQQDRRRESSAAIAKATADSDSTVAIRVCKTPCGHARMIHVDGKGRCTFCECGRYDPSESA